MHLHEIERLIEETCRRWRLPGIACVIGNGDESHVIVRGSADVAKGIDVDARTLFRIASVTKTFTAVAVMQLWEAGCFDLDDPVNDHLQAYRVSRDDVTIRQLLTHTAGIGELVRARDIFRPAAMGMISPHRSVPSLREIYGPVQRVGIAPGTKWAYANHGYATLGQLVADVSAEPFSSYMKSYILDPIGMEHATLVRDRSIDEALATGYRFRRGQIAPVNYKELTMPGAGGLFCSVEEMGAYIATLCRGGTPLLKPDTLATMLTPQFPTAGGFPAMGLGFSLSRHGSNVIGRHGGDLPGFKSALRVAQGGSGVFVTTNCNRSFDLEFALVLEGLADGILGILLPPTEDTSATGCDARDGSTEILGLYRPSRGLLTNTRLWFMFGGEVEVVSRDQQLALRSPWGLLREPLSLERTSDRVFRLSRGGLDGRVRSVPATNGRPTELHLDTNVGLFTLYRRPHRDPMHFIVTICSRLVAGFRQLRLRRSRAIHRKR